MAYLTTPGGEKALMPSERLFRDAMGPFDQKTRRSDQDKPSYLINRVMGEASHCDEDLAALPQTGGAVRGRPAITRVSDKAASRAGCTTA